MRARVTVPLLGYFVVVTPALLGLLFAAEAAIGPLEPMRISTPAPAALIKQPSRKADSIQVLTVREQVPVPASELTAVASLPEAKPAAGPAPQKKGAQAADRKNKPVKVAQVRDQVRVPAYGLAAWASAPEVRAAAASQRKQGKVARTPDYYRGRFARTVTSHSAVY
jgi:hypothetical protein